MSTQSPVVSVGEASRRLRVTNQTVRRWFDNGKLRGVKPGRYRKIYESSIEKLLPNEQHEQHEQHEEN